MLKSKSVAKLIETTLNTNDKDEKFRVVYEMGSYKGADINCIFKQGKGTIRPIANYTNVTTPFNLQIIMPTQCGEDRVDNVVDIVNGLIGELNGKVKNIDGGKAVFLFTPLEIGELESRATVGQSVLIKLEFSVEYSTNVGTKYEMVLLNNPFDYGTVNVRYFSTREEQITWFNDRIDENEFAEILTPNINSLVVTQQRYLNPNNVNINSLLNRNYAIIRETDESQNVKQYYYYVTNANIDQYNLVTLDLSMDTLQTHYIDLEFGDCFISKADINRWIDNGDGTVSFDTTVNSELFEREDVVNVTKRLVSRDVISINNTGIDEMDEWLNDNVLGWIYLYVDSKVPFLTKQGEIKFKSLGYGHYNMSSDAVGQYFKEATLYNSIGCLAFPVMKTRKDIILKDGDTEIVLNRRGLENFLGYTASATVENTTKIYAMKFSLIMPIHYISEDAVTIDSDGNLVINATKRTAGWTELGEDNIIVPHQYDVYTISGSNLDWDVEAIESVQEGGFFNVVNQININNKIKYSFNQQYTFSKEEIIESNHDIKFNPKLLSADYKGLLLSDYLQNGTEYDILKLGKNNLDILYTEALTPDISRRYVRISNLDGVYVPELAENLTGYVVSDDTSMTIETSAYAQMIANNKNFFLQNSTNRNAEMYKSNLSAATTMLSGALNLGSSVATGNYAGATMGLANMGIGLVSQNMIMANKNFELSKKNESMTIDNLKNAPSSIDGARGNVIFNAMYTEMGVVVEIHDILPHEKKIVDDSVNMYGMTLNKVANIKDYDNLRAHHNYIQANIEDIKGEISNPIRDDIRQRFASGIRFWNVDEISYEKENYERWLEA